MNYELRIANDDIIGSASVRRLLLPLLGERAGVRAVLNSNSKGAK